MSGKIFVNYRRDDESGMAGRLYDHLAKRLPTASLFMDVSTMRPGSDFVEELDLQVSECNAFLALIGPGWIASSDKQGRRRLDDPHDFVRVEIGSALRRKVSVIPVLLDGAIMPGADELPDELKALSRRHAMEVRHSRFVSDADAIAEVLGGLMPKAVRRNKSFGIATVAILLLGAGLASFFGWPQIDTTRMYISGMLDWTLRSVSSSEVEHSRYDKGLQRSEQFAAAEHAERARKDALLLKEASEAILKKVESEKQRAEEARQRALNEIEVAAKKAADEAHARALREAETRRQTDAAAAKRKADEDAVAKAEAEAKRRREAQAADERVADARASYGFELGTPVARPFNPLARPSFDCTGYSRTPLSSQARIPQSEILCLDIVAADADREMGIAFSRKIGAMLGPDRQRLIDVQRQWITFRNSHCIASWRDVGDHSRVQKIGACLADVTRRRADELRR